MSKAKPPKAAVRAALPLPAFVPPRSMPFRVVPPPPGACVYFRNIGGALRSCPPRGKVEKYDFDHAVWTLIEEALQRRPRDLGNSREATVVLGGETYTRAAEAAAAAKQTLSAWIRAAVEAALDKEWRP